MEPRGLRKVGVATLIVGLALGIIVPFAQFGGVFPAPWVLGVVVLPLLWGGVWVYLARPTNSWAWLLLQWLSLALACTWFLAGATTWSVQALLAGAVLGLLLLVLWMAPVGVIAAFPARR